MVQSRSRPIIALFLKRLIKMPQVIRKGYTIFSINGLIRGIYILHLKISTKSVNLKRKRLTAKFPLVHDLIPGCCRMRSVDFQPGITQQSCEDQALSHTLLRTCRAHLLSWDDVSQQAAAGAGDRARSDPEHPPCMGGWSRPHCSIYVVVPGLGHAASWEELFRLALELTSTLQFCRTTREQ